MVSLAGKSSNIRSYTVYIYSSGQPYVYEIKGIFCRVGQNHTFIGIYDVRCTYGIFSREITIRTVIYGADIRFWPTLIFCQAGCLPITINHEP